MGVSTNAILFYGYFWENEESIDDILGKPENISDLEFEENYPPEVFRDLCYKVRGQKRPESWERPDWDSLSKDEQSQIWDEQKKADADVTFGTEMDIHCSSSFPLLYLAVSESHISARRGYPACVNSRVCADTSEWDKRLDQIVETMSIDVEGRERGWHIASFWGS